MFTFKLSSASSSSSQRTHLNKRVSYPLSADTSASKTVTPDGNATGVLLGPGNGPPKLPPVHILPPTTSTTVHPPVPLLIPNLSPPIGADSLPPSFASAARDPQNSDTLPELLERLDLGSDSELRKYTKSVLHEMLDVLQDSIQGRSREDVQTRLGLLDDQWRDEKLTAGAKYKLGCLASALKNNDLKRADGMHLALMVDHISEVSQWMVGVKRLINELKMSGHTSSASPVTTLNSKSVGHFSHDVNGPLSDEQPLDVCVDTDKFSGLKPVLMPEMLVPDTVRAFQLQQAEEEQGKKADEPLEQDGLVAGKCNADTSESR